MEKTRNCHLLYRFEPLYRPLSFYRAAVARGYGNAEFTYVQSLYHDTRAATVDLAIPKANMADDFSHRAWIHV